MNSVSGSFMSSKFTSKNSNMIKIEHILITSRFAIFRYGWGSTYVYRVGLAQSVACPPLAR